MSTGMGGSPENKKREREKKSGKPVLSEEDLQCVGGFFLLNAGTPSLPPQLERRGFEKSEPSRSEAGLLFSFWAQS